MNLHTHTQKIIGYAFDKSMTTDLTIKTLENAYLNSKPNKAIILHSDRGTHYTSNTYKDKVKELELDLVQSCSGKGKPYDNACIESFHSILKKQEVNHKLYKSFKEANLAIFEFIEAWYNRTRIPRIHGSINYMTPNEYEKQLKTAS